MMLARPYLLWLFLIYIPLTVWYVMKHRQANPSLTMSSIASLKGHTSWRVVMMHSLFVMRMLAIGLIIIALCRPQTHDHFRTSQIEGTDIILAVDISGSMMTPDFKPNRFEAAKDVATAFVNERENDNIGLVVFAGESLSLMPLTTDRTAVINAIRNIDMSAFNDGTAIGDGLASAINRVASGQAKSKSIILITDGTNNSGDIAPSTAAEIARQKGIRVYTIGIGTNGTAQYVDPYGIPTTIETSIDVETLRSIASMTDGKFFRATDKKMLSKVFEEIDSLEKTKLDVSRHTRTDEDFMPYVWGALILLSLQLLLRHTLFRRIP